MKLEINNNVFWVLFWLIIASCTASEHYANSQVRIAAVECDAKETTDEDSPK